ncbi:conserved Plasmodium protein, unknown function [Plasmodium berghei]|uniref:Uncharacterized protein n=1 Tax=Plasmodium berghei TaxID=5821 RepID=A0A0Y9WKP0_PLABE|nr:conserved Plasmodium protein, unknown function [Plasmodium berghei]SCO60194.1 conserved Plasmodium protein, unknown function [Plasmodium berghei]
MEKFKKCPKKRFRGTHRTKFIIKKQTGIGEENKSTVFPNNYITSIIVKYLNDNKNNVNKHDYDMYEKESQDLKDKLFFNKIEILEIDIIKSCLYFDNDEALQKINYKILYDVLKKCIDHENILMKVEELGFSAENIKSQNDEDIHICSKYQAKNFLNYIYQNLKVVIKMNKNFDILYKLMKIIKSIMHIIPYTYKIKFLFYFCSLFNIYQKEYERKNNTYNNEEIDEKSKEGNKNESTIFTNIDQENFLNILFELITGLMNLKTNYNTYDDNYLIFSYFVLRWILVFFKNKYTFFSKKKIHSLIKSKYMILLFSILKNLHESCNFNADSVLSNTHNDTNILLNNNGATINGENTYPIDQQYLCNASGNYMENFIENSNINKGEFLDQMEEIEDENFNYESTINLNEPSVLDLLCNEKGNKDSIINGSSSIHEKIKNTKNEINNIIKTYYDRVDLNIEKNMKEIKDNINVLTHDIFITFYNLFSKINDIHKHIVLLYFSQDFIKISEYEYSYYIIFNSFQLLNKLLTIENFVIHPLIFLSLEQVMVYYENVIIYLYKKKNDMNEEFYKFCENFNTKHKNIYENIFTRLWNLYMLIISDEYTKKDDNDKLNEKSSAFINLNGNKNDNIGINANQKEMHITNYLNNYISILKINDLHFSNEYKDLILSNTNKGYINCLVSCLSTSYRVIGLCFYLEENYFFTYNELIYRDIFILNRMLKDSNKLYYGGNFKFLMNFFYPLLMCYINLYEKEPNHSIKKELFLSYIKNILIHFSRALNDCINLYYFISTQIEDIYILATKFINCNDHTLLLLFINFLTNFYTSTIKSNQKQKNVGQNILLNMKNVNKHISNVKYKYTNINLQKNNYFLNHISDNLLKIFIPRFIIFLTSTYQQKFTPSNNLVAQENTQNILESFSSLIYLCLHFSSNFNFNDILVVLEQILQNNVEKDIFSLISILNVIKIVIPFFTFDQLKICSIYYKKAMCAINDILNNMLSGFTILENDRHNFGNVNNCGSVQGGPQMNNNNNAYHFDNTFCSQINQNEFHNSSLNEYNAENENFTNNINNIYPNAQNTSSMLYRENGQIILTQEKIGKNDKINNERIITKSKGNKVKNGIKKEERKTKMKRDKKIKNLRKKKITKDVKIEIEKFKLAKFLIFEGVSELFRYFGNIILNKRREKEELMQNRDQNNTRGNWNNGNDINENNTEFMINNNEINIFNSIFVGRIMHEENLPEMMKKENILIFFDDISNYNTNKYIKKIYTYISNLTMYLKECKEIDSSYSYDIFFEILPIIMKWLFFINKTFTSKTSRKALFENIIHIGKANIKSLFLHITPGLLVEDINCKKIAIHILYLLIKYCKIEYEYQKQLFNLFLTCAYNSDKNLLKAFLKFLLSSIFIFNKYIILSNIKNLTNLLNLASNKKTYIYIVQKFFSKLNNMLEKEIKNNKFEKINSSKTGLENIEINSPINENGIDNSNDEPPLMPYLTKKSKQIFRKFIKIEKMNSISNAFENKNELNRNRMNDKQKNGKSGHKDHKNSKISSENNLSSNIMSTKYDDESYSVDSYQSNEYDSDINNYDDVESVRSLKNSDINKNKKERKNKSHKITKNNKNKNIENTFFENVSKHIGEKEKTFIQTTLTQIMAKSNKIHKNVKGKIQKIKSNPLISDILINLGDFIMKNKTNLNVSLKNKKEIKNLFGDKYFIKQNTNNENKNSKNYCSSCSEDDEGQIEIRNDGKIVIHNLDSHSKNTKNTKNKKRKDDILLKKYNIINEKQNMHSKSKIMNKSINKRNKNQFITADKNAYKSKKGKGDIIKKNKPLPYSYVALKPIMAKEKFRSKTLHAFKSIKNLSKRS